MKGRNMKIDETLEKFRRYQYIAIACFICSGIIFLGTLALAAVFVYYKVDKVNLFYLSNIAFWVPGMIGLAGGVIDGIIFIKSLNIFYCPNCEKNLSYLVYDPSYSKPPFFSTYILLPRKIDIDKCPYCGVEI